MPAPWVTCQDPPAPGRRAAASSPQLATVIMTGSVYNAGEPYSTERHDPSTAKSPVCMDDDYHQRPRRAAGVADRVDAERHPDTFVARAYVDTGPVQERVYAQYAGLGWIGRTAALSCGGRLMDAARRDHLHALPLELMRRPSINAGRARYVSKPARRGPSSSLTSLMRPRCLSYSRSVSRVDPRSAPRGPSVIISLRLATFARRCVRGNGRRLDEVRSVVVIRGRSDSSESDLSLARQRRPAGGVHRRYGDDPRRGQRTSQEPRRRAGKLGRSARARGIVGIDIRRRHANRSPRHRPRAVGETAVGH